MIDAATRTVWLLGDPVSHSRSPQLHNPIYQALGLNLVYLAMRVPRGTLPDALRALETIGAVGGNLTMPLKHEALPLLTDITAAARAIGAVNSLRRTPQGWEGENTDWLGWLDSWDRDVKQDLRGRRALVLGAGGAAKAIVYALHARGVASVAVLRREWSEEEWLPGYPIERLPFDEATLHGQLRPGCVVINSTPVGMSSDQRLPLPWPDVLPPGVIACDLISNPQRTRWLEQAGDRGAVELSGLGMLECQAARAITWWSGVTVPS